MKVLKTILIISTILLALTTCKKDPQPIMERFDLSREDLTIGTTSASIVGTYAYSGAIDEITVCVSEDGVHPAMFVADINGKNFTVEMTSLRPATSYQYYYSVDYGFSKPFTTEAKTFTTLSESPTVRTIDVMSIDSTTVRVNCETVSDGGIEITERGVCWNTYGNPNLDDESLTYTSAGLGQYSCRISGLALSTKYYVRAYAKNASGIGFGEVLEFETLAEAQLPEVSTVEVGNVTSTTASCMGNVASDGGLELTERGVCWSLSANPTISGSHAAATDATLGVFEVVMTGLTPNKTYHVRAYATNAKGTAYGADLTFTTTEGLPVVTTSGITEITATSAKGGGEVTDQGASNVTERGICWGTSHNPTISGTHANNGTGAGSYTVSMTNLTPNATYYVRAYATNSQGTAYGAEVSFTALEGLPVVLTLDMTDITSTTAKGHGNVTDQGGSAVTERGVCWSTSPSPTTSGSDANSGTGTGEYTVSISNLTPGTKYYVRAYATNSQGTTYGEQKDFTTAATLPTVVTGDISGTTAHGEVTNAGGAIVTERGICWGTSHNPTTAGTHGSSGTGTGSFSVELTDLAPGTTYYVRAYATNSAGTAYGSEKTLTTQATLPTVTTGEVSNIQQTTAQGSGNVTNSGGANVTERGICWGTSHNPTTSGSHAYNGTGTGSFTVNMTGLTANTTYYVRAYATNSAGTAYGSEVSFSTSQIPSYTISVSASPSSGGTVSGGGTYQQGQSCTVHAAANSGYTFFNWTEGGSQVSTNANYTFTVTGNRTLVAHFTYNGGGGHAYVDLGLPSGLLWATWNVGADSPEDYGDYFAWGETQPKSDYSWGTYQYCNGSASTLTKYCNNASYGYNGFTDNLTTLQPSDDAATANWGTDWRMPTIEEWQELYNSTTHIWTTQNGVKGELFTATNGNSLFLPAAGSRYGTSLGNASTFGGYWSSSLITGGPYVAWCLYFDSGSCRMGGYDRDGGRSVRPVRSASKN